MNSNNSKPPTDIALTNQSITPMVIPSADPNTNPSNITVDEIPLPKFVGIIHSDVKREYFVTEQSYISEKDAILIAESVAGYLEKMGVRVKLYPGNAESLELLRSDKPDMVFNLVDTVKGQTYLCSTYPAALEILDIPYTGADFLGQSLSTNKFLSREILKQAGVPIPDYQMFDSPSDPLSPDLQFPLISKLNEEHAGIEMSYSAISENEKDLRTRLKFLIETYKQPVVVEEYIAGREVTAIVFEGINRKVYMAETVFDRRENEKYAIKTFDVQWLEEGYVTYHYEKFEDDRIKEDVKKAFDAIKMADYAKFDIRIDNANRYYIIDANSNPAFGPKESSSATATILDMYGISFTDILRRLMLNTMKEDIQAETQQPAVV